MPYLHLRVCEAGGPALLFERVRGCGHPAVSNLFGTLARARYLLRHGYERVARVIEARADPAAALRKPLAHLGTPLWGLFALPKRVRSGPVLEHRTQVSALPQIHCWPDDGGPFVTLPQVFSEHPERPGILHSNVGMYRIQLGGNDYVPDAEVRAALPDPPRHRRAPHRRAGAGSTTRERVRRRSAGAHRRSGDAAARGPIRVADVRGHARRAALPLDPPRRPRDLDRRRLRADRHRRAGRDQPEGPFGDHLGYYSLVHAFPVLRVDGVWHRPDAVALHRGRTAQPPWEDTSFGAIIHELTAPMVPRSIPGLQAMHAVDAAGVHPLLLAVGSERYVPWGPRRPAELLTIANAVLGFGQASLAKYLFIAAQQDGAPAPDDEAGFLAHVLARFDPPRSALHTRTTIGLRSTTAAPGSTKGSKLVLAAAGAPLRSLGTTVPASLPLPPGFGQSRSRCRACWWSADHRRRASATRRGNARTGPTPACWRIPPRPGRW
ncbi:MAG: UbiD family decarboxylase [Nannocystaceae bacterium]